MVNFDRPIGEKDCPFPRVCPFVSVDIGGDRCSELLRVNLASKRSGSFPAGRVSESDLPAGRIYRMTADVGHGDAWWSADVRSGIETLEALVNPFLHIDPAEAEVFTYPEARGPFTPMAPRIDGRNGNFEVGGEIVRRQEAIAFIHGSPHRL